MVGGGVGGRGVVNKAEAERLLAASEKLLASNDFQGAKESAIRACKSDPTLAEAADSILTICDVLIAREIRLGENSNLPDWYAALRLGRLAQNPEHVATQYRRLALLLNPSVNRFPLADQAFKVVADAWHVLSDPSRKSLYDREVQLSQLGKPQQQQLSQLGRRQQQNKRFIWKPSQSTNVAKTQQPPPSATTSTVGYPLPTRIDDPTSFWTACPYCFVLFEYPKAYEECVLRCQECRRAFEAVRMQNPPVVGKGEDVHFCSWSVFPLGFSGEFKAPSWSPISPLIACTPLQKVEDELTRSKKRKEPAPPRFFYEDDDIYVAISDDDHEGNEPSDHCQDELQAKNVGKGKEKLVRSNKKHGAEKAGKGVQVKSISGASNLAGSTASYATPVGTSSMSKPMSSRKRTGTGAKNLGRLDLNVEFSNEVDEPAVAGGRNEGNGLGSNREVDNMEGIGFFEDLDEFLSSLPIFSVVGDDKIKAT